MARWKAWLLPSQLSSTVDVQVYLWLGARATHLITLNCFPVRVLLLQNSALSLTWEVNDKQCCLPLWRELGLNLIRILRSELCFRLGFVLVNVFWWGFFFLVWKTVVLQKHYEHKDSFPLLQTGKTEFRYSLCNESGGRTINWSRKSWSGLIFLLFPLSNNEFLLKEGSSHLRSVRFYACLLFYTSNRVMYAFLVTPAEAWKGSTFHFHYISFISLFWRKGSIKYKIDITKISFYCGWKVLVVNVTPHKAAELQVTIKDLEKMSAW